MEGAPTLSTPEEELAYLREQVARKEAELVNRGQQPEREAIITEEIHAHHAAAPEVLAPQYQISEATKADEAEAILKELNLGHDEEAVRRLRDTMETKGIKNALAVLEQTRNPQLADDFHRFLVRHIAAGLPALGLDEKAPRFRALRMTLYEIALPEPKAGEHGREKALKELISGMEQFYAGLLSVGEPIAGEPNYFALELAVPADTPELQFYAAVPNSKRGLFEKQLLAIFPEAHLSVQPNDYNIFSEGNIALASVARLAGNPVLPLKDYTDFDYDPINAVMNAFAKIETVGEGAALQIIIEPRGERHVKHYQKILPALVAISFQN